MNMTHYMELLAVNQPWNLIIFMAIPVVLAETLAITELYLLFARKFGGAVYYLNRFAGIAVGLYFIGIIYYIISNAIIPITKAGEWRTVIDVLAVGSYVIAGLPLVWIALQELGLVNKTLDQMGKLKIHAICVALFLVFGHIGTEGTQSLVLHYANWHWPAFNVADSAICIGAVLIIMSELRKSFGKSPQSQ